MSFERPMSVVKSKNYSAEDVAGWFVVAVVDNNKTFKAYNESKNEFVDLDSGDATFYKSKVKAKDAMKYAAKVFGYNLMFLVAGKNV